MSGGFFRGTTADQDTRFSNKHAKLLKSHKFPPELENLVDMTKVKMDVMRPWIAHRVTELLGFEDEVLINFIYGLLEEKVVNGKEIQISLTGFMEKNTGKFMKELWTHLLSAQQNTSGVPQQFLDAKEEETKKKQEDTARITRELKRIKEKEEQERVKMDREADDVKAANLEAHPRRRTKFSSKWSADDKGTDERNGSKETARIPRSPHSADHSPSPPRGTRPRSVSNSFSNSRSHSSPLPPKRQRKGVITKDHLENVEVEGMTFSSKNDGRTSDPELSSDRVQDSEKGYKADETNQEAVNMPKDQSGSLDSVSEESDHKRKHKRKDVTSGDDNSHDSHAEDRKEAKRRRKEEKKLKKQEKRIRREERRRKKDIRRSEKLKLKAHGNVSPSSDFDKSRDESVALSDEKKLEIELREKALESLRAKKGVAR
ncbi:PWI domain-containing protein C825.05c isoform X3 [Helianthus annuus]|uniref:PWI domain-containing protein C825.05c isoform X3 n=1 Tax=Helianthus annuus TaxID=4232 RepID=UPI000B8FFD99|nr:PWI domain-containing protein C825.05c isoform X3 [Helianthus annuus]